MRAKLIVVVVAAVSANACSPGSEQTSDAAAPAGEWQTLFDGSSLAGWTQVGDANWQLMDGAVAADSGTGFLLTAASYADFDLDLEFWVTPDANSGVFIRCANPSEIGAATCYEVNIFDQRPGPDVSNRGHRRSGGSPRSCLKLAIKLEPLRDFRARAPSRREIERTDDCRH